MAALLGKDGKELMRVNNKGKTLPVEKIDISGDEIFENLNSSDITISYIDKTLSAPYAEIIYPLASGEYIFAVLDLSRLWYSIALQRLGTTGGLYLATQEGFLTFDILSMPEISGQALKEALNSGKGLITAIKNTSGQVFAGAYCPTVLPGVYVVALQYGKEAFYNITLTSWLIAFFLLAATTLSYFAAYAFSKEITEPLEKLTKGSQEISSGIFGVNIKAEGAWGEFDILINAFNEMASRLASYQAVQLDKLLDEKRKMDLLAGLMRDGLIMCGESGTLHRKDPDAGKD